jgi:hypothetical protein
VVPVIRIILATRQISGLKYLCKFTDALSLTNLDSVSNVLLE